MRPPAEHLPPVPKSLDRVRQAELTALTERALRRRRQHLAEAIDVAFEHIPRPLRGAVRRVLGA
jgi:hypothetical protein